jgi:signal transduction histidine kinase
MALTTSASDEHKAFAADMIDDCDRLIGIINTMLDIAEAESGAAGITLEEVDIARVTRRACELFQAIAEENSIRIATELPDSCVVLHSTRRHGHGFGQCG